MLNNIVQSVQTVATVTFSNGVTYQIPFRNNLSQSTDINTYATECRLKRRLYKGNKTNVIGKLCGSTLNIKGKSRDGVLIPSNTSSQYYDYMNNTATVEITVTGSDNVITSMGKYYVDTWTCGNKSDNYDNFEITAIDFTSKIKNIPIRITGLHKRMDLASYLKAIIDKLNDSLDENNSIIYNVAELSKLNSLNLTEANSNVNQIDCTDLESTINQLSQATLCYIWIDETRTLRVDSLIDDSEYEAVSVLSGSTNLTQYSLMQGDISSYSGIRINYLESENIKNDCVLELKDYQLFGGINNIIEATMNKKIVDRVEFVDADCAGTYLPRWADLTLWRDYLRLSINSEVNTPADIKVHGSYIENNVGVYEIFENNQRTENVFEVDNLVLDKSNIDNYGQNLLNLISMRGSNINVAGFINPAIKPSDLVQVIGSRLGINGYYKVVSIDLNLGVNYYCSMELVKTIESVISVDSLLSYDNDYVMFMMGGVINTSYQFYNPSQSEEQLIQAELGTILSSLQNFL